MDILKIIGLIKVFSINDLFKRPWTEGFACSASAFLAEICMDLRTRKCEMCGILLLMRVSIYTRVRYVCVLFIVFFVSWEPNWFFYTIWLVRNEQVDCFQVVKKDGLESEGEKEEECFYSKKKLRSKNK